MKLSLEKNILSHVTSIAQGVANPQQKAMPILGNILIRAQEDGAVVFEASDMDSCVRCTVSGDVETPGSITVNAKRFHDFVERMPDGTVSLDFSGPKAVIRSGAIVYDLATQSDEDFPTWPDLQPNLTLELESPTLKRMLQHVLFALPQRDPRKVLLGSLFDIKDNRLTCVATDGKKLGLSQCNVPVIQGAQPHQTVIPGRLLSEIRRVARTEGEIKLLIGDRQVAFDMGNILYLVNRIDGNYPNYDAVIPDDFTKELTLNRQALLNEVDRAKVISEEQNNSIILRFSSGRIEFSASTSNVGSLHSEMPVEYDGESFDIAFNHIYLSETLRVMDSENVVMHIKQNTSPVVFKIPEQEDSLFLVMPIKLTDIAEYQT